jgi:hypothetical protein
MNATELATKMLEWEKLKRQTLALETEIEAVVLELGKTQNVGNVRATFAKGRTSKTYDWSPVEGRADPELVERYTTRETVTVTKTDWEAVSKELGIDPVVIAKTGEPSVTLKLI